MPTVNDLEMFRGRGIAAGDGLEVRMLESRNAHELFALTDANRAHLRRWLPWLDTVREAKDSKAFIKRGQDLAEGSRGVVAGIWAAGRLCGVIGYNQLDWVNRIATIGYWLGREHEGRGIMTRAVTTLVAVALDDLGLNRIVITVATGNLRSQAIPDRLGFRREGVVRDAEWLYDHYVDHVLNGLLQREWTEAHGSRD